MEIKRKIFLAALVFLIQVFEGLGRATNDLEADKDGATESEEIELHVITKRDVLGDFQKDYPQVNGRTFRASEPLDPKSPKAANARSPQNLFDSFETVNEIFQPQVEAADKNHDETADEEHSNDEDEEENDLDTSQFAGSTTEYAAQYPYSETTESERGSSIYPHQQRDPQRYGYQSGDGVQQTVTSRRVTLVGRGSDTPETGYEDQSSYNTQRRVYTSGNGHSSSSSSSIQYDPHSSGSRYVSSDRRSPSNYNSQYSTDQSGSSGTGYQNSRTEVRGPYYGGERYIDSNGHYVDAQGRHLDSTGRYYDVSGRYADAIMTRTSAYHTPGTGSPHNIESSRYTSGGSGYDSSGRYVTGQSSEGGYYDRDGRYVSSTSGGYYDSQGRYVSRAGDTYDRTETSRVDNTQSRPVDSYGGTQFYSSGNRYQTTYDPVTSQISDDPTCPVTNMRVTINGLSCSSAVAQLGNFVCYNYERVSTECCEICLQVKRSSRTGCEYGDRSNQCRTINPYDCYNERNRQVCCERCQQFREQMGQRSQVGCEYGDLTPRCQSMLQRPHLCYLPENTRICCSTCPRIANSAEPDCQWGNQSPELCEPFDENRQLKIDCYLPDVRQFCCSTCKSLKDRMRDVVPGCEYGDAPTLIYSGSSTLTCGEYIRQYGVDACNFSDIAQKCCYTCYRYRRARG